MHVNIEESGRLAVSAALRLFVGALYFLEHIAVAGDDSFLLGGVQAKKVRYGFGVGHVDTKSIDVNKLFAILQVL